ncbi:Uncharacterised protein [Burkholderia pseudomallei]|nr:Uncharacterised protein [Burkholderia pseudomallei]CAJ7184109.1 Uncharacterised protein [Burkholderia pseudomallei]CAJ7812878.1 Uncharacterised protein [Burkholderia pseudomallei]CAJ8017214.1 Uncharacterised protein [Burkholderia pseudomallei]CAJ8814326.1 Uncharacterised protein [Burkholderia pseudomallei]
MRDHHHRARELEQRVLQRAQRFDVEVVRRLVEQQHVAAGDQRLREVQAAAFAAGQVADDLLLVAALEVEAADVRARRRLVPADRQHVGAARDFLEHRLRAVERIAALVDVRELHRRPQHDFARVRLFLAGQHLEQRRLAGAVRADDADDRAGRDLEVQVVDQQAVAERFADVLELDHFIAEAVADRNEDFLRLVALLVFLAVQFLEARDTRLRLRLTALRVLAHPLQFLLDRLLARRFGRFFLLQAFFLLVEPAAVVAFPRNAVAAVELENPFGRVVEEVAIVRDRDDGAREAHEELLEPVDRFGVQVVGRFVEQQHVGLFEQQLAERDAALLAARQVLDLRVPRGQAQRVGGHFELLLGAAAVARGEDRLVLRLLGRERVEVGIRLRVRRVDLFELLVRLEQVAEALLDGFAHRLARIELRLLRQVADVQVRHRRGFAFDVLVDARHDLDQRRLARAVQTEHADLRTGEERQRDVLQDLALGRHDLADPVHRENVLGHLRD